MRSGLWVASGAISSRVVTCYVIFSFRTKDKKEQLDKNNFPDSCSNFFKNAIVDTVNDPFFSFREPGKAIYSFLLESTAGPA